MKVLIEKRENKLFSVKWKPPRQIVCEILRCECRRALDWDVERDAIVKRGAQKKICEWKTISSHEKVEKWSAKCVARFSPIRDDDDVHTARCPVKWERMLPLINEIINASNGQIEKDN